MSKFEKISSVWTDLNETYKNYAKKYSPAEFIEVILNKKAGEAGKRALIKRLYDSAGQEGVSNSDVEEVVTKINAVDERFKVAPPQTKDLEGWLLQKRSITVDDFTPTQNTTIVTLNELVKGGRLLPEIRLADKDNEIITELCTDYRCVINDFIDGYMLLKQLKEVNENDMLLKLAPIFKEQKEAFPLILIDSEKSEEMHKAIGSMKRKIKELELSNGLRLYSTSDDYGHVFILEV